ncbi:MAG: hypothetical protein ACRENM_08035 [Candidatus Dormibacteraceae bacterium]
MIKLGLLGVLVLLVGLCSLGYHNATQPYRTLPRMTLSSDSVAVAHAKVDDVQSAFDRAQASGKVQPFSQTFTDGELTSLAVQKLDPTEITGLALHSSDDGYLEATATGRFGGQHFPLYIRARISTADGQPQLTLIDTRIGSVAVPGVLKDQINNALQQSASVDFDHSRIADLKVAVGAGQITVSGTAEP